MTFPPFLLASTCCPRIARVASSEELGTMSKNNLRRITLVRGPLWGIHSLTLIISCFSLQFTDIEYQLSSSYRASKSGFFPYIHYKFCLVCPTTKMTSATVKPSISQIDSMLPCICPVIDHR